MGYSKAYQYSDASKGISHLAKVISHPARLKIIFDLQKGRKRVVELVDGHPISVKTLSRHCQLLVKSEILEATVEGKNIYYSCSQTALPVLLKKAINELGDNSIQYFIPPPLKNLND